MNNMKNKSYKIEIYLDYDINKIDTDINEKIQNMIDNIDCNGYDWNIRRIVK